MFGDKVVGGFVDGFGMARRFFFSLGKRRDFAKKIVFQLPEFGQGS
jgi:hypothetical protein